MLHVPFERFNPARMKARGLSPPRGHERQAVHGGHPSPLPAGGNRPATAGPALRPFFYTQSSPQRLWPISRPASGSQEQAAPSPSPSPLDKARARDEWVQQVHAAHGQALSRSHQALVPAIVAGMDAAPGAGAADSTSPDLPPTAAPGQMSIWLDSHNPSASGAGGLLAAHACSALEHVYLQPLQRRPHVRPPSSSWVKRSPGNQLRPKSIVGLPGGGGAPQVDPIGHIIAWPSPARHKHSAAGDRPATTKQRDSARTPVHPKDAPAGRDALLGPLPPPGAVVSHPRR